ncbi:hypothetical protein COCON_G00225070 [Conger conger]|uniref:EGF-like domain-containing protein n=1 Tax=Conger conger TaxID=82655 RepID=A0A9Q1CWC9_CONCO|nr:hypothetical protein COCON_G00225070 [Conger conger]
MSHGACRELTGNRAESVSQDRDGATHGGERETERRERRTPNPPVLRLLLGRRTFDRIPRQLRLRGCQTPFHLAPANFHRRSRMAMDHRLTLSLLVWSCGLLVQNCTGQEEECQCNLSHGRCDESGACRCDPGWEGPQCDDCARMPGCVHGSCHQPWQCTCESGWAGRFCDKDVYVCTNEQPCKNGATCFTNDSGDYSCFCPEGFHGKNCEMKTGPCQRTRSPCKNGGLCEDSNGFAPELSCRCLAGFVGARCEEDVDDCLMRPCANGASCVDGVNRFSCECPAGFSGRFCTVNDDDCAGRPCRNGGRCLDRVAAFQCLCPPGFDGPTCEGPAPWRPGLETRPPPGSPTAGRAAGPGGERLDAGRDGGRRRRRRAAAEDLGEGGGDAAGRRADGGAAGHPAGAGRDDAGRGGADRRPGDAGTLAGPLRPLQPPSLGPTPPPPPPSRSSPRPAPRFPAAQRKNSPGNALGILRDKRATVCGGAVRLHTQEHTRCLSICLRISPFPRAGSAPRAPPIPLRDPANRPGQGWHTSRTPGS